MANLAIELNAVIDVPLLNEEQELKVITLVLELVCFPPDNVKGRLG